MRAVAEKSAVGRKLSSRFVAGTEPGDALQVAQALNQRKLTVSIDNLGENVTQADEAHVSAQLYDRLLNEISSQHLDANVSLKLTHMGLDFDQDLAFKIVSDLVTKAGKMVPRNFVRVDMEGSAYTQRTLDFVRGLHQANPGCVGAVIQSYMRRSEADVETLIKEGIRIRLCKGAYKEPEEIAFQEKSEVDANYIKLMKILLKSGIYHGLATHDQRMIQAAKNFAMHENIPRDSFEFQMLYGIRRDLQRKLVAEGWRMRVYVPFGTEWYPYLMRRLAERPANVFFVLRNLLRK
jgi:proline dehydrogenase